MTKIISDTENVMMNSGCLLSPKKRSPKIKAQIRAIPEENTTKKEDESQLAHSSTEGLEHQK